MARIIKLAVLICFLSFAVSWSSSFSQGDKEEAIERIIIGESKSFATRTPTRVVIANPKIADISNVTQTEINVIGKAAGMTTLVFWDTFGEQSFKIKVLTEDMQALKDRIDNLLRMVNLPQVRTEAQEDEGKVAVLGRVKVAEDKDRIATALGDLKAKTIDLVQVKEEEAVVQIDVQVLEVDRDSTTTLGFTMPGSISLTEVGSPGIASTGAVTNIVGGTNPTSTSTTTTAGTKWSTLFKVLNFSRDAFNFRLDALILEGKARILSRPQLACQSGKEANLLVGGEKPVFTTSVAATTGSSGTSIEYKEFGIKLKIRPTVTEDSRVKVALNVEVSDVGEAETIGSTTSTTAKAFPLIKRSASTELFLDDEQTLSIGGLMKQKTEEELRKLPWLGDIPVLGMFFRKRTTKVGGGSGEKGQTELFITITPTIVSREGDAAAALKNKEEAKHEPAQEKKDTVVEEASQMLPAPIAMYAGIVQKRILENLAYPESAKEAGFQGTVRLSLRFSYLGELLEAKVKDSSGFKILDDNAVTVAKGVASYPPFPTSIDSPELWVDIPVVYRLVAQ